MFSRPRRHPGHRQLTLTSWLPESRTGAVLLAFFLIGFTYLISDGFAMLSSHGYRQLYGYFGIVLILGGFICGGAIWVRAFRLSRKRCAQTCQCSKCGYNLTGNVSGMCPECESQTRNHFPVQKSLPRSAKRRIAFICYILAAITITMWCLTLNSMLVYVRSNALCYAVGGGLLEIGFVWDANRYATIRNSGNPIRGWYFFDDCDYSTHIRAPLSMTMLDMIGLLILTLFISHAWNRLALPPSTNCVRILLVWGIVSSIALRIRIALDWTGFNSIPFASYSIFITILIPLLYHPWRKSRFGPGHCHKCGYNLTGNTSGICPECGTPIAVPEEIPGQQPEAHG